MGLMSRGSKMGRGWRGKCEGCDDNGSTGPSGLPVDNQYDKKLKR